MSQIKDSSVKGVEGIVFRVPTGRVKFKFIDYLRSSILSKADSLTYAINRAREGNLDDVLGLLLPGDRQMIVDRVAHFTTMAEKISLDQSLLTLRAKNKAMYALLCPGEDTDVNRKACRNLLKKFVD